VSRGRLTPDLSIKAVESQLQRAFQK